MNFRRLLLPLCLVCGGVVAGRFTVTDSSPGAPAALARHPTASAPGAAAAEPSPPAFLTERPPARGQGKAWDFLQRLEQTSSADFPGLWAELEAARKENQVPIRAISWEEHLLAERWAELDPAAASEFFLKKPELAQLARAVFGVWSRTDGDAAFAAVKELVSHGQGQQWEAMAGILNAAQKDPAAILSWTRKLFGLDPFAFNEPRVADFLTIETLRRAWMYDPAGCEKLAAEMGTAGSYWVRDRVNAVAIAEEAARDLPAALARLDAAKVSRDDAEGYVLAMMPLADSHPQRLVAIVEHLTEKLGPGWLALKDEGDYLLLALAKAEPERVQAILTKAGAGQQGTANFQASAAASLLSTDPRLALQLVPSSGRAWLDEFASGRAAQVSAVGSPGEVLDLMPGAPPSIMRDALLAGALRELPPEAAAAWIAALPPGELQTVARAAAEGAALNPQLLDLHLAHASATASNDPDILDRVRRLTSTAAQSDPASAAACVAALSEGPARDAALATTGKVWAQYSAPDALAWAESLPPQARGLALAGIMGEWVQYEPVSAADYIAALPADALHDAPLAAFARELQRLDPEASLQWAARVQEAGRRKAVLDEIAAGWMKKDAAAARAAIPGIPGLTIEERERLTKSAAQ